MLPVIELEQKGYAEIPVNGICDECESPEGVSFITFIGLEYIYICQKCASNYEKYKTKMETINISELSIGNYIECYSIESEKWVIDKVYALDLKNNTIFTKDEMDACASDNDGFRPIEVTPIIMERIGKAKYHKHGNFWRLFIRDHFCLEIKFKGDYKYVFHRNTASREGVPITEYENKSISLHWLQNTYKALTFGKELDIDFEKEVVFVHGQTNQGL